MPVTRAADAPKFDLGKTHFTALTAPSRGATELCSWILEMEAGASGEAHWLDREEVFIALEGTLSLKVGGETIQLQPGDALSVPPRTLLEVANSGDGPFRAVVCIPAGVNATFADGREIGTPPWAK